MGLFPRTAGKRFSRPRTCALWGPSAAPFAWVRHPEEGGRSGGNMQNLASLSETTRCSID